MGWSGGTEILDTVVKSLRDNDSDIQTIKKLIKVLEDHDWDVHNESEYWDDPQIRNIMRQLNPDWDD